MKLSSDLREYLKIIAALLGASACILIGGYLYAIAPANPKPAIDMLEMSLVFVIGAMTFGGLAFLTEEEVTE